ncbi:hypothetical protein T265_07514 [Opisthorchis viverrini]|uniref:Uncharacterized protein n=1 Tax=Opisthorchis viverrini TaxID=6198 RepID=A0A074ZGZ6_OPIVI|nr:hypothetical protein T265_07514 [Opisthorchis viverrini]KER24952.1 hypothetical protein T265_07514 [Opisthorchis viverrini]
MHLGEERIQFSSVLHSSAPDWHFNANSYYGTGTSILAMNFENVVLFFGTLTLFSPVKRCMQTVTLLFIPELYPSGELAGFRRSLHTLNFLIMFEMSTVDTTSTRSSTLVWPVEAIALPPLHQCTLDARLQGRAMLLCATSSCQRRNEANRASVEEFHQLIRRSGRFDCFTHEDHVRRLDMVQTQQWYRMHERHA